MHSSANPSEEKSVDPLLLYVKTVVRVFGGTMITETAQSDADSVDMTVKFYCNNGNYLAKIDNALKFEGTQLKEEEEGSNYYTVTVNRRELIQDIEGKLNKPFHKAVFKVLKGEELRIEDAACQYVIDYRGVISAQTPLTEELSKMGLELDSSEPKNEFNDFNIIDMMKFVATLYHLQPKPAASQAIIMAKLGRLSKQLDHEAKTDDRNTQKQKLAQKAFIDNVIANPAPTMRNKVINVVKVTESENLRFLLKGTKSQAFKALLHETLRRPKP
jgi:hypothetical protein